MAISDGAYSGFNMMARCVARACLRPGKYQTFTREAISIIADHDFTFFFGTVMRIAHEPSVHTAPHSHTSNTRSSSALTGPSRIGERLGSPRRAAHVIGWCYASTRSTCKAILDDSHVDEWQPCLSMNRPTSLNIARGGGPRAYCDQEKQ